MNNVIPIKSFADSRTAAVLARKDAEIAALKRENEILKAKTDNRKKLSPWDVQLIRRFWSTAGLTHQDLAEMFEVNRSTISRILNGTYHKGE
ncbi:hypothetical protein CRH09_35765 [Nocardia terpenica]|uniref:Uncharacterized protein n=2 Tax=Nocardia terpenica TaxID=455432 RepID=A0A291RYM4_9NOCA|nr:hypothetical protein CRH09_35765 [Nocardia terpenica]